jgi:hypothetical protein
MRLFITALAFLFSVSFTSYAQDILITNKGEEILVKVIEVSHDNIKYKKYSNLEGPIYIVLKSELFMIKYQNGEKDVFEGIENQSHNIDYSTDLYIEEIYYDGNTISRTVGTKYFGAAIATVGLIVSYNEPNESIVGQILTASGSIIFFISDLIQDIKTAALGNAVSKLYDIENKRLNHIKKNSPVFKKSNPNLKKDNSSISQETIDNVELEIVGCTDESACNFNSDATSDDGSCLELDQCGVCGGSGIPEGACDCEGNRQDALGVCGGLCEADNDNNGICDDLEAMGPLNFTLRDKLIYTDNKGNEYNASILFFEEDGCYKIKYKTKNGRIKRYFICPNNYDNLRLSD